MSTESFITVVSGIPRSGTSLVMQMLRAGGLPLATDGVRGPDAANPRGYFELEAVKHLADDASFLESARGSAVKVVHAGVRHLPDAFDYRVIFLHRDLEEVVASQNAMLGNPAGDLPSERLVEILRAQRDDAERWLAGRSNVRLLRIEFRKVLASPRNAAAEMAAFVDDALDVDAMAAAVDPALYRRRVAASGAD